MMTNLQAFVRRQFFLVYRGGWRWLWRLFCRAFGFLCGLLPGLLFVLIIRLLKPVILIRMNQLISPRIGHLAANTELYLCERDYGINVPPGRYFDIFYHGGVRIANQQLAKMWARILPVAPKWLMEPAYFINKSIPGGSVHEVGYNSQFDRDILNLYNKTPRHLSFSDSEEKKGQEGLRAMGIPDGADFVCLVVRDSAYLNANLPVESRWIYHDYRDSAISDYSLAAEALAGQGCYVVRMGELVNESLRTSKPKVIDYATNGMRSDFMDIYLGANCLFCISTGTGYDAIPTIFRRPIVFVNYLPIGYALTFLPESLFITRRHFLETQDRELSLGEIFEIGAARCLSSECYKNRKVVLRDNTPDEIRDVSLEMLNRLRGKWVDTPNDAALQKRFWEIFDVDICDEYPGMHRRLHGAIQSRYGAQMLRDNANWLH